MSNDPVARMNQRADLEEEGRVSRLGAKPIWEFLRDRASEFTALREQLARARSDALEEAAQIADGEWSTPDYLRNTPARIRALARPTGGNDDGQ